MLAAGVKQVSEEVERALAKIGPARITGRSTMNPCFFFLTFPIIYIWFVLVDVEISTNYSSLPVYHLFSVEILLKILIYIEPF